MVFKNGTYDKLKWVAQILLPAIATLIFSISKIWHLPLAEEIVGTITAIDTFLGCILRISTINYLEQQKIAEEIAEVTEDGR